MLLTPEYKAELQAYLNERRRRKNDGTKDDVLLDKVAEYAESLGLEVEFQDPNNNNYSDDLYIKLKDKGVIFTYQSHKLDPPAYESVFYADVRANFYNHIGMYTYDEVLKLIKDCNNNLSETLKDFS